MKELILGEMTTKDLADWFGITYGTISQSLSRYLTKLSAYADFVKVRRGVYQITRIYCKEYVKPDRTYDKVKSHIPEVWDKSGLDTKQQVTDKIRKTYPADTTTITERTTYKYVCQGSNELYGRPNKDSAGGEIGVCRYALAVRDAVTGLVRWWTPAEMEIKKQKQKNSLPS